MLINSMMNDDYLNYILDKLCKENKTIFLLGDLNINLYIYIYIYI